jgi:hypothetical protein
MSIAAVSALDATGGGEYRTDMVTAFADLAVWYATHEHAPLVTPRLNIPVPPGPRGVRVEALNEIAERLGATVLERDGMLIAERAFGPLVIEAHLVDEQESPVDADYLRGALARVRAQAPAASAA